MAINPIKLTRGLGNGTFLGTIAHRVTQGFDIGVVVIIPTPAIRVISVMAIDRGIAIPYHDRTIIPLPTDTTIKVLH